MARITKLELQQAMDKLGAEVTALRTENSALRTQINAQGATVGERRTTLAERVTARRNAVLRLAHANPHRTSFTEAEVLGAMN